MAATQPRIRFTRDGPEPYAPTHCAATECVLDYVRVATGARQKHAASTTAASPLLRAPREDLSCFECSEHTPPFVE